MIDNVITVPPVTFDSPKGFYVNGVQVDKVEFLKKLVYGDKSSFVVHYGYLTEVTYVSGDNLELELHIVTKVRVGEDVKILASSIHEPYCQSVSAILFKHINDLKTVIERKNAPPTLN